MSHGVELTPAPAAPVPDNAILAMLARGFGKLNQGLLMLSMGALVLTALILTYSVVSRYFFQAPTDCRTKPRSSCWWA